MIANHTTSLSFLLATILFIGCDDEKITPRNDVTLIPVRLEEPGYTLELTYNDQRLLTHSKATGKMPDNDNIITLQEMFYDASGRLMTSTKDNDWRTEYFYEGDVLVRMDEFYKGSLHLDYRFTYNDQGRLAETVTWKVDGVPYNKIVNTWDASGDLWTEKYYEYEQGIFQLKYTNTYSGYDDKMSIDQLFNANATGRHKHLRQHNPAKVETTFVEGIVAIAEAYTYRYDEKGYPTERTATAIFRDGSSRSYVTKYFYEERVEK